MRRTARREGQAAISSQRMFLINEYGGSRSRVVKNEYGCHVVMLERLSASTRQPTGSLPSLMYQNTENHLSGWLGPTL